MGWRTTIITDDNRFIYGIPNPDEILCITVTTNANFCAKNLSIIYSIPKSTAEYFANRLLIPLSEEAIMYLIFIAAITALLKGCFVVP